MSHIKLVSTAVFVLIAHSSLAFSQDGEDDIVSFDSIVNELSSPSSTTRLDHSSTDPFANVLYHAGVGATSSQVTIRNSENKDIRGFMKGIEINLGIDLFSKNWRAEGSFRNFAEEKLSTNLASLKEFDLKLAYQSIPKKSIVFRAGGGLAARYLTFTENVKGTLIRTEYTTPSSLIYLGMGSLISPAISIGAEVAFRSAMIDETADRSSLDASVRIDAKF